MVPSDAAAGLGTVGEVVDETGVLAPEPPEPMHVVRRCGREIVEHEVRQPVERHAGADVDDPRNRMSLALEHGAHGVGGERRPVDEPFERREQQHVVLQVRRTVDRFPLHERTQREEPAGRVRPEPVPERRARIRMRIERLQAGIAGEILERIAIDPEPTCRAGRQPSLLRLYDHERRCRARPARLLDGVAQAGLGERPERDEDDHSGPEDGRGAPRSVLA